MSFLLQALDRKVVMALAGAFIVGWLYLISRTHSIDDDYDQVLCHGQPLRTLEAREAAQVEGYDINRRYDCIEKQSFDRIAAQKAQWQQQQAQAKVARAETARREASLTLQQARKEFQTRIAVTLDRPLPLPTPPARLFVRSDYDSDANRLPAFVTPDPGDGRKHPAIIWLTGGDSNSLDDFWTPGPEASDQSASAFREAGIVMMFPTLRGGNGNARGKEFFFGEVDDVLAAADHLTRLGYVDASQIYLGGHSTGGTLALLTAETSGRFKAVFAFGVVADMDHYPMSIAPVNLMRHDAREFRLRSPIHWLEDISSDTYVIEGKAAPSNIGELEDLCGHNKNPLLHCVAANGVDHFSVLRKVTRVIAARMAISGEGVPFRLNGNEF